MQGMGLKTTASFGFLFFGLGFVEVAKPTLRWDTSKSEASGSAWWSLG